MTATLCEISALSWTRPPADAPLTTVADWYERKAVMLRDLAGELPHAQRLAAQAHAHAVRVLGGEVR